jgi:DNA repair protein RadC
VTRSLRYAARILEIDLVDHVIVGDTKADPLGIGFSSFREHGHLL